MASFAPHSIGPDSEAAKAKDERRVSSDDVDLYRPDSSLEHDAMGGKPTSPQHRNGEAVSSGNTPRKASKVSGGFDRSVEHSPLHPHYQAKSAGKGGMSPSWERRASSEGIHGHAPNIPGRSRLRTVGHGDETPDKSSAVPKFGEWDENNPSSGDGFTGIFNEIRKEKQGSSAKVPIITNDSTYLNSYGQDSSLSSTQQTVGQYSSELKEVVPEEPTFSCPVCRMHRLKHHQRSAAISSVKTVSGPQSKNIKNAPSVPRS